MMRVGLIDVDGKWPNLCLMKLSAYHKARGDTVEWWTPEGRYDLVYKSRVFTDLYSKDTITVSNADRVLLGGTGYGLSVKLPYNIEHFYPDYPLYPQFSDTAYGFLTRGCFRNCGFCVVTAKEGARSVKNADLAEFWRGQREIKLMDANLLACPDRDALLRQLAESRAYVDFTQGLDCRLLDADIIGAINRVRIKEMRFAWDSVAEGEAVLRGLRQYAALAKRKPNGRYATVYVLTNYNSTHAEDLYRIETLRAMGYDPFVMVYDRPSAPPVTRQLQRWVNNKRIFYTIQISRTTFPDGLEARPMTKIDRLKEDLARAEEKAAQWQARAKDIRRRITAIENTEIVQLVHSVAASPEELRGLLDQLRAAKGLPAQQEESEHEM